MDGNIELLNTKEAADLLGVSVSTIRRWSDSGVLKCFRVGQSKYRKFERAVVEQLKTEYYGEKEPGLQLPALSGSAEPQTSRITHSIPAESHPAHYLMHKYWGRKAHNVVRAYLAAYTEEGDTVLEPFMGSGVTVIEALKLKRRVIGIDINPISGFIVGNSISNVDLPRFTKKYNEIVARVRGKYGSLYDTCCPYCGNTARIETAVWENDTLIRIKGVCPVHGDFVRDADASDTEKYSACVQLKQRLLAEKQISYPTDSIMQYVKRSGRTTVDELFSDRALIILSEIRKEIRKTRAKDIRDLLMFCFTSMLSNVSRMLPGDREKATYKSGWVISKFWTPKIHTERNVFSCFQLRYAAILKGKTELSGIDSALCQLYTADAADLSFVADESIDYIFTDPPYGESIAYLALSHFWNCWLDYRVSYDREIIIDPFRKKGYEDYSERTKHAYAELYRVLKDDHYMSFTFHNRDLNVWKAILDACIGAGFVLESIVLQEQAVSSGTQGINRKNTLTGDFIYNFRKTKQKHAAVYAQSHDSVQFIEACIDQFIEAHDGATPSALYEYLIPLIVRNNAYTDEDGRVINIENILRTNYDYVEVTEEGKRSIGGAYKWIKKEQ